MIIPKQHKSCMPLKVLHIVMEHWQLSPTEQSGTNIPKTIFQW